MHTRRPSGPDDPGYIQGTLGEGDAAVHVIDDGADYCMIGRPVGRTPDGSVYVLVARISVYGYEQLRDGDMAMADVWSDSSDISLGGRLRGRRLSRTSPWSAPSDTPTTSLPPTGRQTLSSNSPTTTFPPTTSSGTASCLVSS